MALRVKIFPDVDFIHAYLQIKDLLITDSHPQILHYTGTDPKELKTLIREDRPDLLITHSYSALRAFKNTPQVYHPLRNSTDLLQVKKVYTNSFTLCKRYYERLGLQAEIIIIPSKKPKRADEESRFRIVGRFYSILNRFKDWMNWN